MPKSSTTSLSILTTLALLAAAVSGCAKGCSCKEETPPPKPQAQAAPPPPPPAPPKEAAPAPAPAPEEPAAPNRKTVDAKNLPPVVAEVNGRKLTKEEILERAKKWQADLESLPAERQNQILHSVTENLIAEQALQTAMEKRQLKVDEAKVAKHMEDSLTIFGGSKEEIEKTLSYNPTLKNILAESVRFNEMLDTLYTDEVLKNITVSEAEILDYYNAHKDRYDVPKVIQVRLIAFIHNDDPALKEEKKKLADQTLARIQAGEDFAAVAFAVSEDPGSKALGGYNEQVRAPEGASGEGDPYYDWIYASQPNTVSPVIEYPPNSAWIILKNDGIIPPRTIPLEHEREAIIHVLQGEKAQTNINQFSADLWDNTQIQNNLVEEAPR